MIIHVRSALFSIVFLVGHFFFSFLSPSLSYATMEYARQTGLECKECHIDTIGGGQLTDLGKRFLADVKARGQYRSLSLTKRVIHIIVGYIHLLSAIVWFGTIMYVHILLKPAYASKGLPKGELRLGWISMIAILMSGIFLTIARMPSWSSFISTRFGILLTIKIVLYLFMLCSAVTVTVYIGPRLRKRVATSVSLLSGASTLDDLRQFDGKEGRLAYIAYKGNIYDVSKSKLWKNGLHVMKHAAGNDLTDFLQNAPHGEDKILSLQQVGKLLAMSDKIVRPFHEKLFYFFAYMNLVLVFVITFVIALWRWW
ncbi:MAG TPA: CopD family protein [Nitrospirota bacterium]|nr:CopD family protein [Nitrospirota bacterium]